MDFPNIKQTYTGNMNFSCVVLSPAVATGGNLGRRGRKELGKVVYHDTVPLQFSIVVMNSLNSTPVQYKRY